VGSDSDWCYTARMRGWEVWYCADAEAMHEGGVTSRQLSPEMQQIFANDMGWWKNKWVGTAVFNRLVQQIPFQPESAAPKTTPVTEVSAAR